MQSLIREYWGRRALLVVLTRRTLIARYRGTSLGFLWTFLHPLMLFAVYAVVFGIVVRVEVPNYSAFLLAGLLPWTWFAQGIAVATTSVLADAPWIQQASFSPAVPPLVSNLAGLVNFLFGLVVLLIILALLGVTPTIWLLALPVVIGLQFLFLSGISLATASISVRYRDSVNLVQSLLPMWFFLTPVVYPASMVPDQYRWLLDLNPMTHLIGAYQAILFDGRAPEPLGLGIVFVWGVAAVWIGNRIYVALRDRIPEEL